LQETLMQPLAHRWQAIVFDLDGTLVDTAPDLVAAVNWVLGKHSRPAIAPIAIRAMLGDGARVMLERGFAATGGPLAPDAMPTAIEQFLEHYGQNLATLSRPFPGVVEALEALTAQGCVLGVCTNKFERFSVELLRRLDLTPHFAAICGGDTFEFRKPHGGHVLSTLTRMGAGADAAVMVGDSANDVIAARAAGVPVVAVDFGYSQTPAARLNADRVISHWRELPRVLAEMGPLT
jgi:phosphoglycolate phosphatase